MRCTVAASLLASAAGFSLAPRPATSIATPRCSSPDMCGILAVVNSKLSAEALRLQTLTLQRLVRHRGPDGSGIHVVQAPCGTRCSSVAHERLAIVDPLSGNQPLFSHDMKRSLAVNGEIYNHKELAAKLNDTTPFRTGSDCEVRACAGPAARAAAGPPPPPALQPDVFAGGPARPLGDCARLRRVRRGYGVQAGRRLRFYHAERRDGRGVRGARPHRHQLALHGHRARRLGLVFV
jgi:hypothetical protein